MHERDGEKGRMRASGVRTSDALGTADDKGARGLRRGVSDGRFQLRGVERELESWK